MNKTLWAKGKNATDDELKKLSMYVLSNDAKIGTPNRLKPKIRCEHCKGITAGVNTLSDTLDKVTIKCK